MKSYKEWEKIGLPMSNLLPCLHECSCYLDWNATFPREWKKEFESKNYKPQKKHSELSEEDNRKIVDFYISARDHIA